LTGALVLGYETEKYENSFYFEVRYLGREKLGDLVAKDKRKFHTETLFNFVS